MNGSTSPARIAHVALVAVLFAIGLGLVAAGASADSASNDEFVPFVTDFPKPAANPFIPFVTDFPKPGSYGASKDQFR
jgi:hypothetical protein